MMRQAALKDVEEEREKLRIQKEDHERAEMVCMKCCGNQKEMCASAAVCVHMVGGPYRLWGEGMIL